MEQRRIYLEGKAVATKLSAALLDRVPGPPCYEDRFQRGVVTSEGDGLVVLATRETLDSDQPGAVHITLTTQGLDETRFAAAVDEWWSWWSSHVDGAELAVR
jgi:hypothetical protein